MPNVPVAEILEIGLAGLVHISHILGNQRIFGITTLALREPPPLLGHSPSFQSALDRISRVAPIERPVLIVGERGTGKELVAGRLHYLSRRWEAPFVKVNCAALSGDLLDSELFGHEAGAFTGATRRRAGRFERADGGTLFLDEIATASQQVQEKLLRAVEYGEFERLGGSETLTADVRVVAATNVDLRREAASGRFRADLLDRLAFDVVALPPLRDRPDDIVLLAEAFGRDMAHELERGDWPGFAAAALDRLRRHDWPGNVRELKNVVERAVALSSRPDRPIDAIEIDPFPDLREASDRASQGQRPPIMPDRDTIDLPFDLPEAIERLELRALKGALMANAFNRRRAAAALNLSYDRLRTLIERHADALGLSER